MAVLDSRQALKAEHDQERQLTVQVGPLLGFDVRPSRMFFWLGSERDRGQRIVSLGRPPRVLRRPQQRRFVRAGHTEVSYLGNPVVTVGLSLARGLRQAWRTKREGLR